MSDFARNREKAFTEYKSEAHDFFARFRDLRPREIAIMGGAFLEYGLRHLLESRFADGSETPFVKGPLDTMESRAKVARALGCFPKEILTELLNLGRVRNKFAHNYQISAFDHDDVGQIVALLNFTSMTKAADYFQSQLPDAVSEPVELDGLQDPMILCDSAGRIAFYVDISKNNNAQDLYENSLKITWSALMLGIFQKPR